MPAFPIVLKMCLNPMNSEMKKVLDLFKWTFHLEDLSLGEPVCLQTSLFEVYIYLRKKILLGQLFFRTWITWMYISNLPLSSKLHLLHFHVFQSLCHRILLFCQYCLLQPKLQYPIFFLLSFNCLTRRSNEISDKLYST